MSISISQIMQVLCGKWIPSSVQKVHLSAKIHELLWGRFYGMENRKIWYHIPWPTLLCEPIFSVDAFLNSALLFVSEGEKWEDRFKDSAQNCIVLFHSKKYAVCKFTKYMGIDILYSSLASATYSNTYNFGEGLYACSKCYSHKKWLNLGWYLPIG